MFSPSFFGPTHFAPTYFAPGEEAVFVVQGPQSLIGSPGGGTVLDVKRATDHRRRRMTLERIQRDDDELLLIIVRRLDDILK